MTGQLPVRSKKKARRMEDRAVFLLFHQGSVALRRRPKQGLLAGLWEYPCVLDTETAAFLASLSLPSAPVFSGVGRHIFTHVEWHMNAYVLHVASPSLPDGWVWADATALADIFAIPSAFSAFQDIVSTNLHLDS